MSIGCLGLLTGDRGLYLRDNSVVSIDFESGTEVWQGAESPLKPVSTYLPPYHWCMYSNCKAEHWRHLDLRKYLSPRTEQPHRVESGFPTPCDGRSPVLYGFRSSATAQLGVECSWVFGWSLSGSRDSEFPNCWGRLLQRIQCSHWKPQRYFKCFLWMHVWDV